MPGKVEICGVNTARLKVLSQKEMESLLQKAKDGDETARETLIEGNLRLVLSVIQDVILCRLQLFGATTDLVPCGIILICILHSSNQMTFFS